MKFLVPNYICLQNPLLKGYGPQIPFLSILCPQLNFSTPSPNKIPRYATASWNNIHDTFPTGTAQDITAALGTSTTDCPMMGLLMTGLNKWEKTRRESFTVY